MTKNKKKLWLAVCIFLLFTISVGIFAGCNQGKKYDVAIRIGCSDGNVYEFPVGTDEMHIEIPYDGVERRYGVKAYNLPDHPRWSKEWFSPSGEGANVFSLGDYLYGDGERWATTVKRVLEQGCYCITVHADSSSNIWNPRTVQLFITVF
ncbi:MAG: hypothetical protein ACI4MB_02235 [Candidatus Coproplasma sp.]